MLYSNYIPIDKVPVSHQEFKLIMILHNLCKNFSYDFCIYARLIK